MAIRIINNSKLQPEVVAVVKKKIFMLTDTSTSFIQKLRNDVDLLHKAHHLLILMSIIGCFFSEECRF